MTDDDQNSLPFGDDPSAGRPVVRISHELHNDVDLAVRALADDGDIYQRDGDLVRVLRTDTIDAERGIIEGTPVIRAMKEATLKERLTRAAIFERWDGRGGAYRRTLPPDSVVRAVHGRGAWGGFRTLFGITETPCLRGDGTILDRPGYDPATGLLYVPSQRFEPVPEAPTQADAMRALLRLTDVFHDFPYASEGARYVPIAMLLTLLARPAIRGACPAFIFDASTRGAGKTMQVDVVLIVTTGRSAPKLSYPAGNEEELEKVLSSCALCGSNVVAFDNVTGAFGAGPLDKVLTADDEVALRVLGKSELRNLRWRAVVTVTGNNVALAADTARRCMISRIEPPSETPEDRTDFRHPDLIGYARSHRSELVQAALTVLRAFVAAGRPGADAFNWGSFTAWAKLIPAAIAYAGGANVLDTRAVRLGVEEPEVEALRVVLSQLPQLAPEGITTKSLIELLYPPERVRGQAAPDSWNDLREAIEVFAPTPSGKAPDPRRFGAAIRKFKGRIVGGHKLDGVTAMGGVLRWVVRTA